MSSLLTNVPLTSALGFRRLGCGILSPGLVLHNCMICESRKALNMAPKYGNSKTTQGRSADSRMSSLKPDVKDKADEDDDQIDVDEELGKLKEMPPLLMREDFIEQYKLEFEGINPHRLRREDENEEWVSMLFGKRRGKAGRAGYRWADCKERVVVDRIKLLHPILYQHDADSIPPFIKIKFAHGIAIEHNGKPIDWAAFGQVTNNTQRTRIANQRKKLLLCKEKGLEVSKDTWKKVKVEKSGPSVSRKVISMPTCLFALTG